MVSYPSSSWITRWRLSPQAGQYPWEIALSEADLRFVVETVATERRDYDHIVELVRDKPDFLEAMLEDAKLFRRISEDKDVLLKVSPRLLFDVLLRRALREMERGAYTLERVGSGEGIPVFDSQRVVALMQQPKLRSYLSHMLASFTKVESTTVYFRKGQRHYRRTYSNIDVDDMISLAGVVEEKLRLPLYQRIGDICLFIAGIFPEHMAGLYSNPLALRFGRRRRRRGLEDYAEDARRFYALAAERAAEKEADLGQVLSLLTQNFGLARKPLNFIADNYIKVHKRQWFA